MAIISFQKNPVQREFVFNPYRNSAYVGAIRSGKTVGCAARVLMLCDLFPGSRFLVARKTHVALFDTTWREVIRLVAARNGGSMEPGPYVKKWDGALNDLTLYNGSIIHARYFDDIERILGLELSGGWIDQAEELEEEHWDHLDSRLSYWNNDRREAFKLERGYFPKHFWMLTANPDPGFLKTLLFDNPKTRGEWMVYQTTIEQNRRNLGPGYIEKLYATHPKDWCDRFLQGSWDIRSEQVYKEFNEDLHCITAFKIPGHWMRYISLDWGINEYHRCAVLWHAISEKGVQYTYKELSVTGQLVSQVAAKIKAMCVGDPVQRTEDNGILVYMDPHTDARGGIVERTIFQEFGIHGIYGIKANNDVDAGINKVSEALHTNHETGKPSAFIFRGMCPWLVRSLKLYRWKPPNSNGISEEKPMKTNDDEADAYRYGRMAILEDRSPKKPKAVDAPLVIGGGQEKAPTYDEMVMKQMLQPDPEPEPEEMFP